MSKIFAFTLIAVGLVCLGFGINAATSPTEEVVEAVSGRYTENTMIYIIGGIAMLVGGTGLLLMRSKK